MPLARYDEPAWEPDSSNKAKLLVGTQVTIYLNSGLTVLATLWANEAGTVPLANPLTVDAEGNVAFWVDAQNVWMKIGTRPARQVPMRPTLDTANALSKIDTVLQSVLGPIRWMVGQAFGQDIRRYGTLGGDATVNTATVNAALANSSEWDKLVIPFSGDLPINDDLVIPLMMGKEFEGFSCNPTKGPASTGGTRFVQQGANKNILRIANSCRALRFRKLGFVYSSQQLVDNGKAAVLVDVPPEGGGIHDIAFEDVSVERAHRAFYAPMFAVTGGSWNLDFERVRVWWTTHSAFQLIGVGQPSNTFRQVFISNSPGSHTDPNRAPVPTGPCIDIWNGEFLFDGLDIEGWNNLAFKSFGCSTSIRNLHIEHHTFTAGGDGDGLTSVMRTEGGPLEVQGWIFFQTLEPGAFSSVYASIFKSLGNRSSVDIRNLVLGVPALLAGQVALLDGDVLKDCYVGPWHNVGDKAMTLLAPSTFWPDHGYRIAPGVGLPANAAPTSGKWNLGDRVYNSEPAVGEPTGWVCTVAGTTAAPATFRPFGVIA